MCLYHPELVYQHPTHLCDLLDGVVRVGSLCLNHPEVVHKHPTHLALSVMVWLCRFDEVRCACTTPN